MINLIQGEDKTISVQLKKTTGYVDLTSVTEISAKFKTATGTPLVKLLSTNGIAVTSAVNGLFDVTLSDTETATLTVGAAQDWEITVDIGSNRKVYQVLANLNVTAKLF